WAGTRAAWSRPLIMASPILPAPRNPIRLPVTLIAPPPRSGPRPRGSGTEDRRAHPHHGRPFVDRDLEIAAHAHGQVLEAHGVPRSEEHTSELQSHHDLVCRLLLEK